MEKMVIHFKDISTNLGTRISGAEVREQIIGHINNGEKLVFDFSNVDVVSNSFADECFAKLIFSFEMNKIKEVTTFQNASPFIKTVIATAFKERLYKLQEA
jgi:hypothetical protein